MDVAEAGTCRSNWYLNGDKQQLCLSPRARRAMLSVGGRESRDSSIVLEVELRPYPLAPNNVPGSSFSTVDVRYAINSLIGGCPQAHYCKT